MDAENNVAGKSSNIREKIHNQNKLMEEIEEAERKDREFVEFQLRILL